MSSAPALTAADMIRQLTNTYTTTERGNFLQRVRVRVPTPTTGNPDNAWTTIVVHDQPHTITVEHRSLLDQLGNVTTGNSALDDENAGTRFESKPAGHLEAIQLIARIEAQSWDLADELGCPPKYDVRSRLGAIAGKLGVEPHPRVRSWWVQARILTQWDAPAYRPQGAPCPGCWETGSLRIRFDDELATCIECHAVWDRTGDPEHGSLDLLGQHVKWCTDHEVTKARHWVLDNAGELAECVECLTFRDAYTEWRFTKQARQTRRDIPA